VHRIGVFVASNPASGPYPAQFQWLCVSCGCHCSAGIWEYFAACDINERPSNLLLWLNSGSSKSIVRSLSTRREATDLGMQILEPNCQRREEYPVAYGMLAIVVSKEANIGSYEAAMKCEKVSPVGAVAVNSLAFFHPWICCWIENTTFMGGAFATAGSILSCLRSLMTYKSVPGAGR
jgi:hypothetical protein